MFTESSYLASHCGMTNGQGLVELCAIKRRRGMCQIQFRRADTFKVIQQKSTEVNGNQRKSTEIAKVTLVQYILT